MNRLLRGVAALASVGLLSCATIAFGPRPAAAAEEWVSLFDGKTLSGWTMVEPQAGSSKWEVVDGVLTGSGKASMLYSPRADYKNFRIRAEVKINDKGNSGMYFRTSKEGFFGGGYEAQIDSTHTDPIRTGSIYTMVHIYKQLVPPDTWFAYEVECVDKNFRGKVVPHIRVTLNGELLYEYLDHTSAFKEGHFAFQQHDPGSKVQIRKVEVLELPATQAPAKKKAG